MQFLVENIKYKEEEGYETSAARYAAEMDMWRVVALEKKKLAEENERLNASCTEFEQKCASVKADTVREMQERLTKEFDRMHKSNFLTVEVRQWIIDQIANELLEDSKND